MAYATGFIPSIIERLRRCTRGVATVEFAIGTPIVFAGLISMLDLGLALNDRMAMDRGLRAGAAAAMADITDAAAVQAIVEESSGGVQNVTVAVTEVCECGKVGVLCSSLCTGGAQPDLFLEISADKVYEGILLGGYDLTSTTRVRVR